MYNTRNLNHAVVTDKFHQSPVLVLFLCLWIWPDLKNHNCRLHVTTFWVNKNVQTTKYQVIQENDLYRQYNILACPWRAHTFNPQTSCMFEEMNLGYMSLSSEKSHQMTRNCWDQFSTWCPFCIQLFECGYTTLSSLNGSLRCTLSYDQSTCEGHRATTTYSLVNDSEI